MSNKKIRSAALEGYSSARFPDSLSRIHREMYRPATLPYFRTPAFIDYFFKEVVKSPHNVVYYPVTSDGYKWLARADFSLDKARYAFLMPMAMDTQNVDGDTLADRHCALYPHMDQKVHVEGWMISHAGRYLSALFEEERREHAGHHRRHPRPIH